MSVNFLICDERKKISLNIPTKLLQEIDGSRKETNQDRSSWIISALLSKLAQTKNKAKLGKIG